MIRRLNLFSKPAWNSTLDSWRDSADGREDRVATYAEFWERTQRRKGTDLVLLLSLLLKLDTLMSVCMSVCMNPI